MTEAGRCLGVDLGRVRVGLALSDPLGLTAQPLQVVEHVGPRRGVERVAQAVEEHGVTTVIVGLPLLLSGADGERAKEARTFVERLVRRLPGIRVELWDERFTTAQAQRTMIDASVRRSTRKETIDAVAAALILQSWLDAQAPRR